MHDMVDRSLISLFCLDWVGYLDSCLRPTRGKGDENVKLPTGHRNFFFRCRLVFLAPVTVTENYFSILSILLELRSTRIDHLVLLSIVRSFYNYGGLSYDRCRIEK